MNTDTQKIFDNISNWANMTRAERQNFLYALESAINTQKANKTIASAENEFYESKKKANDLKVFYDYHYTTSNGYTGLDVGGKRDKDLELSNQRLQAFVDEFYEWATENGIDVNYQREIGEKPWYRKKTGTPTTHYYADFKSSGQQLVNEYKSFIDWLTKSDAVKYAKLIEKYQEVVRDYESQLAKLNEIYKEANESLVAAALIQANIATSGGGSVSLLSANYEHL